MQYSSFVHFLCWLLDAVYLAASCNPGAGAMKGFLSVNMEGSMLTELTLLGLGGGSYP